MDNGVTNLTPAQLAVRDTLRMNLDKHTQAANVAKLDVRKFEIALGIAKASFEDAQQRMESFSKALADLGYTDPGTLALSAGSTMPVGGEDTSPDRETVVEQASE